MHSPAHHGDRFGHYYLGCGGALGFSLRLDTFLYICSCIFFAGTFDTTGVGRFWFGAMVFSHKSEAFWRATSTRCSD